MPIIIEWVRIFLVPFEFLPFKEMIYRTFRGAIGILKKIAELYQFRLIKRVEFVGKYKNLEKKPDKFLKNKLLIHVTIFYCIL